MIEILGAIHVAGIAHVIVVARIAGRGESIMPANRVLHDFNQRLKFAVKGFGWQARGGITATQQRAGDCGVERQVKSLVNFARRQGLKIRTLTTGDIDHLDIFTSAHQIGCSCACLDADILQGISHGFWQDTGAISRLATARNAQFYIGSRILIFRRHGSTRSRNDENAITLNFEFSGRTGRRAFPKEAHCFSLAQINIAALKR